MPYTRAGCGKSARPVRRGGGHLPISGRSLSTLLVHFIVLVFSFQNNRPRHSVAFQSGARPHALHSASRKTLNNKSNRHLYKKSFILCVLCVLCGSISFLILNPLAPHTDNPSPSSLPKTPHPILLHPSSTHPPTPHRFL